MRNVPERLHRELHKRAKSRGQTLTDYVREILEREVSRPPADEVFDRIESMSPVNLDIRVAELVTRGTRAARNLLTTVLDASATVEYLLGTSRAITFRQAVRSLASLHIPALCDVEVASSLRRLLLQGSLREDRAKEALRDYLDLPLIRHGHSTLLGRVLSLRSSFSAYDATYIALAERLGATLVTGDEVLARAVESHLEIETMLI